MFLLGHLDSPDRGSTGPGQTSLAVVDDVQACRSKRPDSKPVLPGQEPGRARCAVTGREPLLSIGPGSQAPELALALMQGLLSAWVASDDDASSKKQS
ncbi:hypothetical protein [Burkholderia cepacia]|uniref:hypothetical protein n=1 Tax=Burkholderia cepacia TaxID=292 RepID=UPI003EDF422E